MWRPWRMQILLLVPNWLQSSSTLLLLIQKLFGWCRRRKSRNRGWRKTPWTLFPWTKGNQVFSTKFSWCNQNLKIKLYHLWIYINFCLKIYMIYVFYSTDEVYGSAVCRKTVNKTEEMLKINRAGAVSGYFKGTKNWNKDKVKGLIIVPKYYRIRATQIF